MSYAELSKKARAAESALKDQRTRRQAGEAALEAARRAVEAAEGLHRARLVSGEATDPSGIPRLVEAVARCQGDLALLTAAETEAARALVAVERQAENALKEEWDRIATQATERLIELARPLALLGWQALHNAGRGQSFDGFTSDVVRAIEGGCYQPSSELTAGVNLPETHPQSALLGTIERLELRG